MRRAALFTTIALVGALVPSVLGQTGDEPRPEQELRVLDPPGDVKAVGPAGNQSAPPGFDHVDLRAVWIANETLPRIEFGAAVQRFENPTTTPAGARSLSIFFNVDQNRYRLDHSSGAQGVCPGGTMTRRTPGGSIYLECVEAQVDAASKSVRFILPREELINESYVPFAAGHKITNLYAEASAGAPAVLFAPEVPADVMDRAPDAGTAGPYTSTLGNITSSGDLRLFTPEPIRVSNGESTTLVYPLHVNNTGTKEHQVLIELQNPERSWQVRAPERVIVPAGKSVIVPIILSMAFEHRHGEIAYFAVRAESRDDAASWSEMQLGVFWTDRPQPAGHHNTLWFHSGDLRPGYAVGLGASVCQTRALWMNPVTTQESATPDEGVPACAWNVFDPVAPAQSLTSPYVEWRAPLNPELLIGLDFDTSTPATFKVSIKSPLQAQRAVLKTTLFYCDPDSQEKDDGFAFACPGATIAIGKGVSAPRSFTAGGSVEFETIIALDPKADLLPFKKNSNLGLLVSLSTDSPIANPFYNSPETSPMLLPRSGELVLPLVEYHDPIDQAFEAVGTLRLEALGPFEKPVNPGGRVGFHFLLTNTGTKTHAVRIELEGPNSEWAEVREGAEHDIEAGAARNLTLVVDVPDTATPGERAELFVVVESLDDPNVVAISRLRAAVVDPAVQLVPQETDLLGSSDPAGTSGLGSLVAIAVCMGIVAGRRRR